MSQNNNNNNNNNDDDDTPLGRLLRGLLQTTDTTSSSTTAMDRNAIVVAKVDIPSLGIWKDQSYELQNIYLQGMNSETNSIVDKIPLDSLIIVGNSESVKIPTGYTQYIELYNPTYHKSKGAVKVTPEEVGLVSLRTEVLDSVLFALPVLGFWTATSWMFAKTYNDRYGGNFLDALFGR
jgi:hypothetical protein